MYRVYENGQYGDECNIDEYIDPENDNFDLTTFKNENKKCVWQGDEADFGWIKV